MHAKLLCKGEPGSFPAYQPRCMSYPQSEEAMALLLKCVIQNALQTRPGPLTGKHLHNILQGHAALHQQRVVGRQRLAQPLHQLQRAARAGGGRKKAWRSNSVSQLEEGAPLTKHNKTRGQCGGLPSVQAVQHSAGTHQRCQRDGPFSTAGACQHHNTLSPLPTPPVAAAPTCGPAGLPAQGLPLQQAAQQWWRCACIPRPCAVVYSLQSGQRSGVPGCKAGPSMCNTASPLAAYNSAQGHMTCQEHPPSTACRLNPTKQ